ncbi:hypothetical protein BSL78_19375 [Apostichopus japonicus]|uniref:Uncharacterized protein n=1 Tax=Stichopus japonicus TaxID=307972 RepID=A0A2G8K6X9_STIJA|nr:hypothetical protein BSL78_19375 [Apostichopus japonicus]
MESVPNTLPKSRPAALWSQYPTLYPSHDCRTMESVPNTLPKSRPGALWSQYPTLYQVKTWRTMESVPKRSSQVTLAHCGVSTQHSTHVTTCRTMESVPNTLPKSRPAALWSQYPNSTKSRPAALWSQYPTLYPSHDLPHYGVSTQHSTQVTTCRTMESVPNTLPKSWPHALAAML